VAPLEQRTHPKSFSTFSSFFTIGYYAANALVAAEAAADNNNNSSSSDIFDVNTDVTPLTHCGARND